MKVDKKILFVAFTMAFMLWFGVNAYAYDQMNQDEIYKLCVRATDKVADGHLSPEMIMAMIEAESAYCPDVSAGSCKGLMQINDTFHYSRMDKYKADDIYNPYTNILVGTDYIWELFQQYEDPYLVLMVYNMGPSKAIKLYDQGIYSAYARKIMRRAEEIEKERGK